jgi:hypothetical protein
MCKILVLTKTTKLKNRRLVAETIASHLQTDHKDGFGYAIQGVSGVYGERTIAKEFKSRFGIEKLEVKDKIFVPTSNRFGTPSQNQGGAIFHGRTSTNNAGLDNCHPINKNAWSLIHNGVVSNHGPEYKALTSNDTEHLVEYLSTVGISGIEQHITGYYAIGAFDPHGNLHVIRDSIAPLMVAYNKTLDCFIYGTTERLIQDVSDELKWTIGPIEKVLDNVHLIYNVQGELIHNEAIKSRGFDEVESIYSERSLGYKIYDKNPSNNYGYEAWKEELSCADAGYTFKDWTGRVMTYAEFMACDEVTKLDCVVTRPDGTIVDGEDYYGERLA